MACGNISRPQKLPGTFVIMKIKQLINTGPRKIELQEQLFQKLSDNSILVQNEYTAISVGTEVYNFIYGIIQVHLVLHGDSWLYACSPNILTS